MSTPGTVLAFAPVQHAHLIPYIAAIHAACITHDRAVATFLPPLSHEKLLAWWKDRIAEVGDGTRQIYLLVGDLEPDARPKGPDVMGVVMLALPPAETARVRGAVEMLLVHKNARRRGAATKLMEALEADALQRGRTMLWAEMETGTPAEDLYRRLGYTELGRIPRFGLNPAGGTSGATFVYKQLEP